MFPLTRRVFETCREQYSGALMLACSILFVTQLIAQETDSTQWTPTDLLQVKAVGGVVPSPDGSRVAFTVREAVMDDKESTFITQIHVSETATGKSRQFTFHEKSSAGPGWSPDGEWLAFTSSRSGKNNIWVMSASGGEARQLTDVKSGVSTYRWSPDGAAIAFAMAEPKSEEEEKADKGKDDARVVDENLKSTHLWLVAINADAREPAEARRLTEGEFSVGTGFGASFDWSPDGKSIAFSHAPTPQINDWPLSDLSIVDVDSARVRPLAQTKAAEFNPRYSPDGKWIAYTASDIPPTWAFTSRVQIVRTSGGNPTPLAKSSDEQPGIIGWAADGKSIYITETHGTIRRLMKLPTDGSAEQAVSTPDLMMASMTLNASRSHIGFTSENMARPQEAFVSSLRSFSPKQISAVQDLPEKPLGKTEVISWTSADGMKIEGLLTYPVGYRKGSKVPLLVIVHGGPTGVFMQRFIGNRGAYPIAAFASRGYAVLRCNVRGSSGYGREFRYANYGDWGGGDYQDIMSGIDHLVKSGIADEKKLGVMGWSYGGFMTSWIITQTARFQAASVGAGVTNLMSFTGTADIPGFIPDYFGGEYWDEFEAWRSHSAMFNVKGVSTPTLIQHGERDLRVPVSQGYELYNALKRQGVATKMVVYPRQPHGIREPKLLRDAMQRNLDWFDQWIMDGKELSQKSGD